ncbi:MAG: hypothetical protein JW794_02595 [Candidatus Cloacimonetes bacterium]|nr:hypothetical protein [Candidatus Cloacimonadota bacterium]
MNTRRNFFKTRIFIILLVVVLFALYFSPYLIRGKNVFIPIHDNLNQLNMQGIFDGKYRANFYPNSDTKEYTLPTAHSIFHVSHFKLDKLFFLFDYFWGYVFNEFFYRVLSFIGMFFLLKIFIFKRKLPDYVSVIFSLAWISLPFWPQGNLSIAGIPLLILGFINIYQNRYIALSYLIIVVYSLYSNFFFSGIYIFILLIILNIYFLIKRRTNLHFFLASVLFFLLAVISHFPVFYNLLILKIPTNRAVQVMEKYNFVDSLKNMLFLFFNSIKLSHSYHSYLIFPTCLIFSIIILKFGKKQEKKIILGLWGLQCVLVFIYGIYFFRPFSFLYDTLNIGFNFSRIYVLKTLILYILWALCIKYFYDIYKKKSIALGIITILLLAQIVINFSYSTIKTYRGHPTFKEFMSEQQFDEIKLQVDDCNAEYRIGCIGFFPAVANYNGFKTIGSFSAYYPIEFKEKFYKVIKDELGSSEILTDYFIHHGSALFLFDDAIGKNYYDQHFIKKNIPEISCELNLSELRKFDVKYLFSTSKINNADEIGIKLQLVSDTPKYYYKLYIYQL